MANKKQTELQDEKTLEQVFAELQDVIEKMETEESLDQSFHLYHQGMDMLKLCSEKIDKVEKQMLLLDDEGETHDFENAF